VVISLDNQSRPMCCSQGVHGLVAACQQLCQPLTGRGASLDSQAKTCEVCTGFVRRIGAWRWARASSGRSKKICGSHTRSWPQLHPFYQKLNELLEAERFDEFVESRCAKFYAEKYGRPSLTPGIYFRALLIGYFEGIRRCRVRLRALYLALGLKPIVQVVTVSPSALPVKFVGTLPNLLLNREQDGRLVRLRGEC
jgi:hypothetical protein